MVRSFGAETPILSYGPRAHTNPGGRNDRAWVLWPAWAFRVVVPEFSHRKNNALQKAVLGILRASRLTAVELGERLGVHPELAAFVVVELQAQGRVNEHWGVTKRGIEVLDEVSEESVNLAPGWVFRDPWSASLWPFVASSLEYARTKLTNSGNPILALGTTGRPWHQRTYMQVPPGACSASMPNAKEVLRAALRHSRLARRSHRLDLWAEDDFGAVNPIRFELNRVTTIEPQPEPVFLVTYLYVPRDDDVDIDWHACDFFGRGSSPELRRIIARVASDDQRLANELDRILGRTLHGCFHDFKRAVAGRKYQANKLLEGTLTIDIQRHAAVAEPLGELLESWLEVRELGQEAAQWRRRGVLTTCRRVLERLFGEMARSWPLAGVSEQLSCDDGEVNAAKFRGTAAALGFDEPPEALCRVKQRQVYSASEYQDNWRLRPLLAATMLLAQDAEGHPLRATAQKAPDFLSKVEQVVSSAGGAAHDGKDEHFKQSLLDDCVQETLEIVGLALNLPIRPIHEVMKERQPDEQEEESFNSKEGQAKENPR